MRGLVLLYVSACFTIQAAEVDNLIAGRIPEEAILRSGKTFAWIRALEADAAREPANAEIHASLALGYFLLGQRQFSQSEIERALAIDRRSIQANYIAGRIAMELDSDYRAAIPRFRVVLAAAADNFKARYFLGICLRNIGRRAEALQEFRSASVNAPYDWPFIAIAEEELNGGDPHRALAAALKACEMNKSAENLVLAGKSWEALNENAKALAYFQAAAKAAPDWDTPHYLLARIYSKLPGEISAARAERTRFEALRNAAQ